MNYFLDMLGHYGYLVLAVTLFLEVLALPMPGELLMMYCGFLVYSHKLNWGISIIVAASGSIAGITLAYFIGKMLERSFFEKYGHYVHLDPENLKKVSSWFDRYGNILLTAAYFIPGVRHITGYFSGITEVSYKKFSIHAYSGAVLWAVAFISLGKLFGSDWQKYHTLMTRYVLIGAVIFAAAGSAFYFYRLHKTTLIEKVIKLLNRGIRTFHSMGRVKMLVGGTAVTLLVFSALVIGIIEDFLGNEFAQFDYVTRHLTTLIFGENAAYGMKLAGSLTSVYFLGFIVSLTILWVALKGKDKLLEIRFTLICAAGAFLFSKILTEFFHRTGPAGTAHIYTFPSSQAITAVSLYGFLFFMLLRHSEKLLHHSMLLIIPNQIKKTLRICMLCVNNQGL